MRILFVGSILPTEYETRIPALSSGDNRFMWNIIGGLESLGHEVAIISFFDKVIDGIDLSKLRESCAAHGIEIFLKEELKEFKAKAVSMLDKSESLLVYNISESWGKLAEAADDKGVKSAIILSDFPGTDEDEGFFYNMKVKKLIKEIEWYDTAICLSDVYKDKLNKAQNFLLIEGGLNVSDYMGMSLSHDHQGMNYLYLGPLDEESGIDIMLRAFKEFNDPSAVLYVAGKGDKLSEVIKYCTWDKRITYLDAMDRVEYLKYLNICHALLLPRDMSLKVNEHVFPSRLIEYLASGRIIVSTKFPGWERFEGCCIFTDSNAPAFKDGLRIAKAANERLANQIFENNRRRALDYDWKAQAAKIAGVLR